MRSLQCCGVSRVGKRCTRLGSFAGESLLSWWCSRHVGCARGQLSDVSSLVSLGNSGLATTEEVVLDGTGF